MTEATPLASEQITPEDREAAATLYEWFHALSSSRDAALKSAQFVRDGGGDGWNTVQLFARHRIAALSASPAPSGQGVSGEVAAAIAQWPTADELEASGKAPWFGEQPVKQHARRWRGREWVPLEAAESQLQFWQRRDYERELTVRAYELTLAAPAPSCAPGEVERFVIRRNGAFFRPNAAGYTNHVVAAGFYTREESDSYASVEGVTIEPLERYRADAERTIAEAKRLIAALSPQGLDAKGLRALLQSLADAPHASYPGQLVKHVYASDCSACIASHLLRQWPHATPSQRLDAATVERCAQVADAEASQMDEVHADIRRTDNNRNAAWNQARAAQRVAAAIRALATERGKGA